MASEGVMLASAVLLAGVAIAAVFFGLRSLTASRLAASPPVAPATQPPRVDGPQLDPFPIVTLRPKRPWTIIVAATLLVFENIAWVFGTFAGLSTGMLPSGLSFLGMLFALLPWLCALGLVEGYSWAWWLVVTFRMLAFVKLAWGTILLSAGFEQPWLSVAEVPDWFQNALLAIIWAYELAMLLPLFTPSARKWCSPNKF